LWNKLTLFLKYPELELSTNLAENSMRPIAIQTVAEITPTAYAAKQVE
jgi:Transposase IS66 family